jgi:hypothetical protein
MADEPEEIVFDVANQPGGPSPEEQAIVDEEQRRFIERYKAELAPIEEEARRKLQEKLDAAIAERTSLIEMVRSHEARLKVLEGKLNG